MKKKTHMILLYNNNIMSKQIVDIKADTLSAKSLLKEQSAYHIIDNMSSYGVGANDDYYLFTNGVDNGDDGTVTYDNVNKWLEIDSSTFTKTWVTTPAATGGLDHVKYLAYHKTAVTLPDDGSEVLYEVVASGKQTIGTIPGALQPGVTNPLSDLRIAGSAINTIDYATWMVYDVFFTDETIYAFYERLPFGRTDFGGSDVNYHAFSHAIPIGSRDRTDPINDFARVGIAINKSKGYVRWLVNGVEKFRVTDLGMPIDRKYRILDHGGISQRVTQNTLNVGFGTFTLLDMSNPSASDPAIAMTMAAAATKDANTPLLQLGLPAQYIDPDQVNTATGADIAATFLDNTDGNRLFGNGAVLRIKSLSVVQQDGVLEM